MNKEHSQHERQSGHANPAGHGHKPYTMTAISLAVSFVLMYGLMYSIADRVEHIYLNLSNTYMAA